MIPIRPVKKKEEIDLSILPSKRLLYRSTIDNGKRRKKRTSNWRGEKDRCPFLFQQKNTTKCLLECWIQTCGSRSIEENPPTISTTYTHIYLHVYIRLHFWCCTRDVGHSLPPLSPLPQRKLGFLESIRIYIASTMSTILRYAMREVKAMQNREGLRCRGCGTRICVVQYSSSRFFI